MMMKKLIAAVFLTLALAFAAVSPVSAQQKQVSLQSVYDKAVANYDAGNYPEAKAGFLAVLKAKPGYVYARKYLAKTELAIKNPPKNDKTMEAPLAVLTVPKFTFKDASFGDVLDFLAEKSTELSGGKVTANFIYKGPAEDRDKKLITLSLANVPLTEVIRYVGAQAGVRFSYEKYAVVGTPLADAKKADVAVAKEDPSLLEPARKSFLEEREEKQRDSAQNPFK